MAKTCFWIFWWEQKRMRLNLGHKHSKVGKKTPTFSFIFTDLFMTPFWDNNGSRTIAGKLTINPKMYCLFGIKETETSGGEERLLSTGWKYVRTKNLNRGHQVIEILVVNEQKGNGYVGIGYHIFLSLISCILIHSILCFFVVPFQLQVFMSFSWLQTIVPFFGAVFLYSIFSGLLTMTLT